MKGNMQIKNAGVGSRTPTVVRTTHPFACRSSPSAPLHPSFPTFWAFGGTWVTGDKTSALTMEMQGRRGQQNRKRLVRKIERSRLIPEVEPRMCRSRGVEILIPDSRNLENH